LAGVVVQFVPTGEPKKQPPISHATTDDKGRYVLMCENNKSGAVIGKHSVLIIVGRSEDENKQPETAVPNGYTNLAKTPLKIDVTADKHTYDLELTAKGTGEKK